jgi:hypothetical protein
MLVILQQLIIEVTIGWLDTYPRIRIWGGNKE